MKRILFLILMHCIAIGYAFPQSKTITGLVLDGTGQPVIGANVVVKGRTEGTITDLDGKFTLKVNQSKGALIQVSFVGMVTKEIPLTGATNYQVTLEDDTHTLEQVVVVGYGTVKKSDLTGSVESIKAEKLNMGGATNVAQMLQGRVAGLYISSHNQDPGTTTDIMLRGVGSLSGSSQPLIVVDGFPASDASILNTINPSDIEQMDVLKDASATAIYGARGANGVIIVTTKKGKKGEKISIDYGTKLSMETVGRKVDVMNSEEYIRYYYDLAHDADYALNLPDGYEGKKYPYPLGAIGTVADTDWQRELTKRNRITQDHNLSISGGSESLSYRVSFNYYDGNGIVGPYDYSRFNMMSKIAYQKNRFAFSADLSYTKENSNTAKNSYLNALRFAPTMGRYDDAGALTLFPVSSVEWFNNPFYNEENIDSSSEVNTTRFFVTGSYEILKGLKIEGRVGYERKFNEAFSYQNETSFSQDTGGVTNGNTANLSIDAIATYVNSWNKHNFSVMAATNYQTFRSRGASLSGQGFSSSTIRYYSMGAVSDKLNRDMSSYWNESVNQSFLSRMTYDYDNRYYLTFNYRLDGASQFGDNNKLGHFPSVAVAWKINNEKFFGDHYINNLKLKLGYGLSGNANVPAGRSQALISYIPVYLGSTIKNGITWNGGYYPNPDLHWEGAKTFNVGLEVGGKHFSVDVNAYQKRSYDLLIDRPLPVESGYGQITLNKGELLNYGIETKVDGYLNFLGGKLYWNPSFWLAYNHNSLEKFDGSKVPTLEVWEDKTSMGYAGMMQEGYSMGSLFGYDYLGVWQQNEAAEAAVYGARPGDPKFLDRKTVKPDGTIVDGPDGVIDDADKRYMGSTYPTITLGFSSTLKYKEWSLSFMLDGVLNRKAVNYNRLYMLNPQIVPYGNLSREALQRWTPDRPNTDIPSFTRSVDKNLVASTFCIDDASFCRLREVTLAYQHEFSPKFFIRNLRVFVTGTNLATITSYKGLNPDITGLDTTWNLQPIPRTYLLGINLMF